jgi:phosphatidylglycerol lysyltransferase
MFHSVQRAAPPTPAHEPDLGHAPAHLVTAVPTSDALPPPAANESVALEDAGAGSRLSRIFGLALIAAVIAGIAFLLHDLASGLDVGQVLSSAAATPLRLVVLSLVFSAVSYVTLIGYDALAARVATTKPLPLKTVALGAFTSYSVGHALGFPLVTAGAIRWRIYGGAGLSFAEVAKLTAVSSVTLWVGVAAVAGLSAALDPASLAALDHLTGMGNRLLGLGFIVALLGYVAWSGTGERTLGRGVAEVRLPGWRASLCQVALGVVDVCASAAALWVLLPPEAAIGFPAFAAVFAAAILLAVASHVPAGLGAFEAALLLACPDVPPAGLLSAALVWRITYTLTPFLASLALLGLHEARRSNTRVAMAVRRTREVSQPFIPMALAALTFIGGLVLLTSGALPNDWTRMRALKHLLPLPFTEISHLVASCAGVVLLVLSRGLMRRLASAWALAVAVIGAGMVLSLAKGFDWEEALTLGAVLSLLLVYRKAFYRQAGIMAEPLEPRWILAIGFVMACTIWLGMAAFGDVDYSHQLWWQFDWHDDASRFLRGSLAAVVVGAAISLYTLIHSPAAAEAEHPDPAALEPAFDHAARADAHLAYLEDKRFLFHPEGDAFLMYAVRGKSWIAMGDPVGNPERAADLMWRFLEQVDHHAGWPVFYQVSPTYLPLYLDGGLSLIKLGEEARVDLTTFSTEGKAGRDWRNALNRAKRDGLAFEIIPAADVPVYLPELKEISDAWLAERGSGEKGFSIGYWSESYLSRFDIAVVRRGNQIVAFANIWYGQPGGEITIDLMRHRPGVTGVMDLLFVSLMQEGRARGYRWFNLGMAPLSGLSAHRLAPSWHKVAAFVARNGERFYGFDGLRSYKEKYRPVWEPRYLACPGGWSLPQVLIDVTSVISGGSAKAAVRGGRS